VENWASNNILRHILSRNVYTDWRRLPGVELFKVVVLFIIIVITEHLILRPKMQANSKAHAILLPIKFSTEKDEFSAFS